MEKVKKPMVSNYFYVVLMQILFLLFFDIVAINAGTSKNPLYVDPASQDFSENPDLLERIRSSPHGYFRFINIIFSKEVCRRFGKSIKGTPSLNLHGDAHIEQYAMTGLGRGLTDYDDSSTGPAFIDWMRFGVSLNLACRANGWEKQADVLFDGFLRGYREALNHPDVIVHEPALSQRIRAKFEVDREGYFKWINSIMDSMPQKEEDSLLVAMQSYVETMFAESSGLNRDYFDVVKMGYLRIGIGSALDRKYLVRVQGKSDDPLDDVVLECKEVRDLSGIECINPGQNTNPFRILLAQARIAYQPFHHLGYFYFDDCTFWVHSWVDNYKEVHINKSFQSSEELGEVAYDIGVQLGKGHVKHIADPFGLQLRREQLQILNKHEKEIKQACRELADQTVAAWKKFCDKL